jgi:hypothetical protein
MASEQKSPWVKILEQEVDAHDWSTEQRLARARRILGVFANFSADLCSQADKDGTRRSWFPGVGSVAVRFLDPSRAEVHFVTGDSKTQLTSRYHKPAGILFVPEGVLHYGAVSVRSADVDDNLSHLPHAWRDGGLSLEPGWGGPSMSADKITDLNNQVIRVAHHVLAEQPIITVQPASPDMTSAQAS